MAELKEARVQLEAEIRSSIGSEKLAFMELSGGLLSAVRNGVPPLHGVAACLEFAKTAADVSEDVLESMATDLVRYLGRVGVSLDSEKLAGMAAYDLNDKHPLRVQAVKVAELRGFRVRGEIALDDIRLQQSRVEMELRDALYQ